MTKPSTRTDSLSVKLQLLQAAYEAGRYDLAMALADSVKDGLALDRQTDTELPPPSISADHFATVDQLPQAWAEWARGWSYCKCLALCETVGIPRTGEPVDIAVAFRRDQTGDLHRELRVARIDPHRLTLQEIPSQLYDLRRREGVFHGRIVFLADVPMHDRATYLVFYGNANAERPEYVTDLKVTGEGYGLDIENHHYRARMSRQMGQLERLTYKRQHGLELYAGGKGHGEPPMIDWGHDYVDVGHFQKFRMRNWSQCRNYEVDRGPLCVRVRLWGFPHSPVHPVFTPSRVHMDETYVFYAGSPYFLKEGRFDVVKDVAIEAMRDDEWVFSGYSFTDMLWIDGQGKLHEGVAPNEDLWGVGFYHRDSHDAFMALRLQHDAQGFAGLQHGGAPTLHYDGHGQLWSRYPAERTKLTAGATIRQRNAYLVGTHAADDAPDELQQMRHRLVHPPEVVSDAVPSLHSAVAVGRLARPGEGEEGGEMKAAIWKVLREVQDEQLYHMDANIVDMGYVLDVRERHGDVRVLVTMPHRGRPEYEFLVTQGGGRVADGIRERVLRVPGVRNAYVEFTWEPPWSVARLSETACQALGLEF